MLRLEERSGSAALRAATLALAHAIGLVPCFTLVRSLGFANGRGKLTPA
jgi:hypothetical protein